MLSGLIVKRQWSNKSPLIRLYIDSDKKAKVVKDFAIAHFLRSVHPINYFLVPLTTNKGDIKKTNIYWYDYGNGGKEEREIGEYSKLIEYVTAKIKEMYKDVMGISCKSIYQEFLDLIYPTGNCINPTGVNVTIDAEYAIGIWQKKIGGTSSVTAASSTPTKSSTSRTRSTYTIELIPSDKDLFKRELLTKRQAKRIITYKDGSVKTEIWDASNFSSASKLGGNVSSQIYHRKDKDQIDKVVFVV